VHNSQALISMDIEAALKRRAQLDGCRMVALRGTQRLRRHETRGSSLTTWRCVSRYSSRSAKFRIPISLFSALADPDHHSHSR
jgi:hypothetical protein